MNTNTSADTTAPADSKTPVSLAAVLNYAWGMTMLCLVKKRKEQKLKV